MTDTNKELSDGERIAELKGTCEFFDPEPFLKAADILASADEPLKALDLLTNLPGYYRQHIPPEILKLKREILEAMVTPAWYARNPHDANIMSDEQAERTLDGTTRGNAIRQDVEALNKEGLTPIIMDIGPGEYWLPIGLMAKKLDFKYYDIGLQQDAQKKVNDKIKHLYPIEGEEIQASIFVACELIEHLHHESDIRTEFERLGGDANIIHVSTPKYTFDGRKERLGAWRKHQELGHLRTYTPGEFMNKMMRMFPEYAWAFVDGPVMHCRGVRGE